MHSLRIKKQAGFTLIEILVALSIAALVSVLSWRGAQQVVNSAEHIQKLQHHADMHRALWQRLSSDAQLLNTIKNIKTKTDTSAFANHASSSMLGASLNALPNGFQLEGVFRNPNLPTKYQIVTWQLQGTTLLRTQQNGNGQIEQTEPWPIAVEGLKVRLWESETWGWSHSVGKPQDMHGSSTYPMLSSQPIHSGQAQPENMPVEQAVFLEVQMTSEGRVMTYLLPAGVIP